MSPARIHVDEMDVCDIPMIPGGPLYGFCIGNDYTESDIHIGKDDTRGSAVYVLYREWLYQRKKNKTTNEKHVRTMEKTLNLS